MSWLIVEVEDSALEDRPLDGAKLRYLAATGGALFPEQRSVDEIMKAAIAQGREVRFANSMVLPIHPRIWETIKLKVLADLRNRLSRNIRTHSVSIEPVAIIHNSRAVKNPNRKV